MTHLHRVRVHHPRHCLLVRRHVRRRDVELRADERRELGSQPARDPRHLVRRKLPGVATNAPLRPAVRQAQKRAFPRHPHRERRAFTEIDRLVVADSALRRAEHRGVLHAVGGERPVRAVVHLDGEHQDQRPLGMPQAGRRQLGDVGELDGDAVLFGVQHGEHAAVTGENDRTLG